ncbi:hypothetical protein SUGI_0945240 [Cryptomeria japonica]|nr:hypothetical protein SUGI_0945240 [Cryptomeria japonica]
MEATSFLKHLWTILKKKSDTLKDKADEIMNTQMLLLKSMKNDNILGSVSNRIKFNWRHRFSGKFKRRDSEKKEDLNNPSMELLCASPDRQELESLSQRLFGGSDASGSPRTPEIRSENEIDRIAGSFIRRFHNQIKLQKQDSYNAMLARSV